MKTTRRIALLSLGLLLCLLPVVARGEGSTYEEYRRILPDFSEGRLGVLGPFVWARALDLGEDARFVDANGAPSHEGEFLWTHQYMRMPSQKMLGTILHGRSNFVSRRAQVAYQLQPWSFVLNTTGAHNSKVIMGYVQTDPEQPYQHGDNADLAHLGKGDRVVVFFPVRPNPAVGDVLDQRRYAVNTLRNIQPICVLQFRAGEMIQYEWFRNPEVVDEHVLLELQDHFMGENTLYPGITRPIIQFDIDGQGGWRLRVQRDGRNGRPGDDDAEWDLVFTHESPGARPYTVNVTNENSAWSLSLFSPGGRPADTSQITLGLKPYDRRTGEATDWPDRRPRIRDLEVGRLPGTLRDLERRDARQPARGE